MLCISNCYRKDGFVEGWLVWLFIQSFMGSRPWFAFRASKTRSDRLSSLLDALNRTKSRVCGFVYFDGWQVNARKYVHTDFLFDIGYTSGPFLLYCRNIPLPIFILDIAVNWILVLLSIRNSYLSFWHRSIKRYLCSSEKVDRKGYGTPLFDRTNQLMKPIKRKSFNWSVSKTVTARTSHQTIITMGKSKKQVEEEFKLSK